MNINTFDLNLLRVFSAIYTERNVSRAALKLGMTQPAISNALIRLRRSCDDPLFVRTSRAMEPTSTATEMFPPIKQVLSILKESFDQPSKFDPLTSQRRFKLLMSDAGETVILAKLMAALYLQAPRVEVEAVQMPHSSYAQALEDGSVDLAFGNLPFLKAGFYQQKLFSDPYLCIASKHHPLVKKKSLKLSDFLSAPHILVTSGNADALVEQALTKKRVKRNIPLRLSNYHVAVEIVSKTGLLATVPLKVVTPAVQALALPFSIQPAEVRQFWHRRAHHDVANKWLRNLLALMFEISADKASL
ncbi:MULTISPECIES: LysR family transcriptional regulator [Polaromonas]|uniref:LysR family transcriptional regulator n=1 Tax=Polaromonas aquatica TaxID=332657 RepID=A0ABW1TT88_9BURK